MAVPKARARRTRATASTERANARSKPRQVIPFPVSKAKARAPSVAKVRGVMSHEKSWRVLGTNIDRIIHAFESGRGIKGKLQDLDRTLARMKRMSVPRKLEPEQIHVRIAEIRTSFNLGEVERRINALVVAKRINMKQRGELMKRIHTANQLREKVTIRLASMSPSDAAKPSVAAMGPDFLPRPVKSRVPRFLRAAYRIWNREPWPGEKRKTA